MRTLLGLGAAMALAGCADVLGLSQFDRLSEGAKCGEEYGEWRCGNGLACEGGFCVPACGNGKPDPGEACDDGNGVETDDCVACRAAVCGDGFTRVGVEDCDDGPTGSATCTDACKAIVCGDGVTDPGEDCDDANQDDTDACVGCRSAVCGDGKVHAGVEGCDDGNQDDTDGCLPGCVPATCGDGKVQAGVEGCDDGNQIDDDGCTNDCSLPGCGDGVMQMGEPCDDGNQDDTDGCLSTCQLATCGDGFVQSGVEGCDDQNADPTDGCIDCALATCGDGFVQAGVEACDDGNMDEEDACTTLCAPPSCGDGLLQPGLGEWCDDGNGVTGDGCGECQYVVDVVASELHACAVLSNGTVKCWGFNVDGQLGLGDVMARGDGPNEMGPNLPVVQLGNDNGGGSFHVVQLATGGNHTCALSQFDGVKCWGANTNGKLGLGDLNARGDGPNEMGLSLPQLPLNATHLALGSQFSCLLQSGGLVRCFGDGANGIPGQGNTNDVGDAPNELNLLPAVPLDAGYSATQLRTGLLHACAIGTNGSVKCWGGNGFGQLGLGDVATRGDGAGEMGATLPVVSLGFTPVELALGVYHSCARSSAGAVKCWGRNTWGELGVGDTVNRGDGPGEMGASLPFVALGSVSQVKTISAGPRGYHTCALFMNGALKCWGDNTAGALGYGDLQDRGDQPNEMGDALPFVDVGTGLSIDKVAIGGNFTCALTTDRRVKCWGFNAVGQLGLGDTMDRGGTAGSMGDQLPFLLLP